MSVFTSKWNEYGPGRLTPNDGLEDKELLAKLKRYRKTVAKRYRICEPGNFKRFLPKGKLWISPKVDGQLWFLIKKDGEVAMCSYNGRVMQGVPVVDEAAKLLKRAGDVIIPGELFALPPKGEGRPRVHHTNSALGSGNLAKTLGFKAFDVLEEDGEDQLNVEYETRLGRLNELLAGGKRASAVLTEESDSDSIGNFYNEWVQSGKFEGIVARSEQGLIYKIKPQISLDAVIVAYGETNREGIDMLRELSVAVMRDDGTLHIIGTVGNGFSEQDRMDWRLRLQEHHAPSSFRMANREGTLVHFVKPEIVVEIKISDLVETDSSDLPVRRVVVRYDEENGYESLGMMPIPSMLFPIFVREREDKAVDTANIGLDQVYRHIPFVGRDESPEQVALNESKIVKRAVYTKTTKGNTAVRKYVVVQTNKSEDDPNWPPYVVHFTDFSPNRKDPLKTDLRVAPDEDEIMEAVDAWITKNVKKGWALAEE